MRVPLLWNAGLLVGAIAAAFGLAACGDDDGGGGGSDEAYVAAVCAAVLAFQDDINEILLDPENADATEEEATELFLKPLEDYVGRLKRANPPSDVKPYHDQVVDSADAALKRVREEGTLDAFDDVAEPDDPPQAVRDRLRAAAAANDDCVEADFTFED
jgi:hypothetical protein